ncbi:NUDIX hydrolase (plasmid) [Streptomyces sp. NBC_01724]|uniref:NUDIX hydrolase n=1 Tax=Streptomyces sp. NBC_01724 TaxID=2975922 RepID=UPI002E31DF4B|nr:NUDIX hydrolase [Streptomyces sp. NBC_01724]
MTKPLLHVSAAELFEVQGLRFVESALPELSVEHRLAMNRVWDETVEDNPSAFDGPAVACTGLDWEEPGTLVLSWARATYRYRGLRRVSGAPSVSSVFVCVVQPTDDGSLVVGHMSSSTATPDRLQLPGGVLEPPLHGEPLDAAVLRSNAARELVEETGIDTPPQDLELWLVTRGASGSVGFVFLAPGCRTELVHGRFDALVSSEKALGREPELDQIMLVRSPAELANLGGTAVDYLEPVLRRYAGSAAVRAR